MAGKPQVTLTFAGDSSKLESAFSKVGESARGMEGEVGKASKKVGESADAFDRAGEAADSVDTKAMGFRDTMTGVQDTGLGLSKIMKGDLFEGFLTLGMGVGDLASGMFNFVIPAIKSMTLSMVGNAVQSVRAAAASVVHRSAMFAGAVATRVMTVAQRGLNLALRANPIGLVITAIALLVGGIVIAYKRSETFRSVVQTAMRGVQAAFKWVTDSGAILLGWFQKLPGRIGTFFGGLASTISSPFRRAFQAVKDFWNNTIGGKGFSVPDWIPGVGGRSFSIPRFHTGGIMPGAPGSEGLALLQAGERITPAGRTRAGETRPEMVEVRVFIGDRELTDIVRTEVSSGNRALKRALGAGAVRLA